jgi:hypothetical protein
MPAPTVFISYSHDNEGHKDWVVSSPVKQTVGSETLARCWASTRRSTP